MLTIFNGRRRTLGGAKTKIYAQLNVEFRNHLHLLKGAPLAVFLAIALHANRHGWSWPKRKLLKKETGYNVQTISIALGKLCSITIEDQHLLLKYQPKGGNSGTFDSNHYLIFPSPEEIRTYGKAIQMELPCIGFPSTAEPYTVEPATVQPATENLFTKESHLKGEPDSKEKPKKEQAGSQAGFCYLHDVQMTLRTKNGESWYSHKRTDGKWCRGAGQALQIDLIVCSCGRYIPEAAQCEHGCWTCCKKCWEEIEGEPDDWKPATEAHTDFLQPEAK